MNGLAKILHPLSHPQKRVWYTESMYPHSAVHNIGGCVRFYGMVDLVCMEASIHAVLRAHEGTRLQLSAESIVPQQYVVGYRPFKLPICDFSRLSDPQAAYGQWVREEAATPFVLYDSPLFYIALFKIDEHDSGFLLKAHHIICDGWSMDVLTKHILSEYRSRLEGSPPEQAELKSSYLNYLSLEQQYLTSQRFDANRQFWKNKFKTLPEPLFDKVGSSLRGNRKTRILDKVATANMKSQLDDYNLSLPLFLTAALGLLFGKYCQKEDLVLAVPVANRNAVTKPMVGMFTSTLPLRLHIQGSICLRTYLQRVRREFTHSLANHKYPYDLLVHDLQLRKQGHDSLYQVAFNYYNTHLHTEMENITIANEEFYSGEQAYPIQLLVKEWMDDGTLSFSFDYQEELFSGEDVETLFECLFHLLQQMLTNPDLPVKDLELLTERQLNQSVYKFNVQSKHKYPYDRTVIDLFEENARLHPDRVAVSHGGSSMTYRQLSEQVTQLSIGLASEYFLRERVVGIMMKHSPELVVALLATLKAGAAFLPIDPSLPPARIDFMLREAEAVCLLVDGEGNVRGLAGIPAVNVQQFANHIREDVQLNSVCHPDDLAYIIYTSGSTGQPKGVMIPHSNLTNYITWAASTYITSEHDVFAFYSSISFDLTLTSLFVPLVSGTQLRIYSQNEKEYTLHQIIRENKATIIKLTPSHLALLQDATPGNTALRTLIVGGESLKTNVASKVQQLYGQSLTIYNEYGPTEATVGCMIHRFNWLNDRGAAVPIGIPAANAKLYVLDQDQKPLPMGAVGELYISGHGVATGYLHRQDITHFLPDPFAEGYTMYRTGDLVRFGASNMLEYIGRNDTQIKVRGYRIEKEEIEQCLLACEGIRNVAVLAEEIHHNTELIAYVVCDLPELPDLKRKLAGMLPVYMVPHQVVAVPEIPLTGNGKLDKARLAQYAPAFSDQQYEENRFSTNETHLLDALRMILERESVSLEDHFFHIGGDSIKAIQISGLLKSWGLQLSAADILDHPYVRDMLLCIAEHKSVGMQTAAEGAVAVTPIISWFFSQQLANPNYYLQSMLLEIEDTVPLSVISDGLKALIRHHDSLRLCYDAEQNLLFYNNTYDVDVFPLTELNLQLYPETQQEQRLVEHASTFKRGFHLDGKDNLPFRACLIQMHGKKRRLLLAAHHICIDGVSWRILLEDLAGWLNNGGTQGLPPKTDSYQHWAAALVENGEELFQSELAQWHSAADQEDMGLKSLQATRGPRQECRERTIILSRVHTEAMLDGAACAHTTTPEELLQTALVMALHEVFCSENLLIWLERHGREPLFPDIDVSRTVGWFTSQYPVQVTIDGKKEEKENRQHIREQFRNVPHKGIGYGVLAYMLHRLKPTASREVLFNYLGEFPTSYGEGAIRLLNLPTGPDIAGENKLPFDLEINVYVLNRQLHIVLHYTPTLELERNMDMFIHTYETKITGWIAQGADTDDIHFTPSDFEEVELSQQELDSLFK